MPDWIFTVEARNLDQRIDTRGFVERLRRDPQVAFVLSDESGQGPIQFNIRVTFVPGFNQPLSQELYEVYLRHRLSELSPNLNGDVLPRGFAEPLRRNRDYQSSARPVFLVDQLPDGILPAFQVDEVPQGNPRSSLDRLAEAPLRPDSMFMDQRDYDDLVQWANSVGHVPPTRDAVASTVTPEPESPSFWERLLNDE